MGVGDHFIWGSKSILFLIKRCLDSDDGSVYLISFWSVWLLQEPTVRSGCSGLCAHDGGTVSGEDCSFWGPTLLHLPVFQKESGNMKFLFYFETGPYYVALTVLAVLRDPPVSASLCTTMPGRAFILKLHTNKTCLLGPDLSWDTFVWVWILILPLIKYDLGQDTCSVLLVVQWR